MLADGNVDVRGGGSVEAVRLDVTHHTHDGEPACLWIISKFNAISDRIFTWPIAPPKRLIDQYNLLRGIRIGFGETSSREQRDLQYAEIFRTGGDIFRKGHAFRVGSAPFNHERKFVAGLGQGQAI